MPDLLKLETADWSLNVWSRDIEPAQKQLASTLAARQVKREVTRIRLQPSKFKACIPIPCINEHELHLCEPVFFENRSYEFEFAFSANVDEAEIRHRLSAVCDAFRFTNNSLRGTLNTGNDIGWLRLGLRYRRAGVWQDAAIALEVLPTKMVMADDLQQINTAIDETYPLWRFALAQKTDVELAQSRQPFERFPLLWLAQFAALREALLKEVRYICNAPHNRLQETVRAVRAERLHGRINPGLEERVAEAVKNGELHLRFQTTSRRLSVDTPENRFIRMVLEHCTRSLARFAASAQRHNSAPDRERISSAFFNELSQWQQQISQKLAHPLFGEVGKFDGMARESLVLHQRAGYAGVYRIWQQLKLYLDLFGRNASVSVKPVSELYEVWCLLEIRRQLQCLDFVEQDSSKALLREKNLEKELIDGMGASFVFTRSDGIKLHLAHEPIFKKPGSQYDRIYSWNAIQKPDIVLKATFPNGESIIWIFDAKYRIETDEKTGHDLAPDDALNQMHRYRDALIHLGEPVDGIAPKSRPVVGAYVLYPGWHTDQHDPADNPYHAAIEAVGIGAFPALPGQANQWLASFLLDHLGSKPSSIEYRIEAPDEHLARDSVRIAPSGLQLRRSAELVLVAQTGGGRTPEYLEGFRNGTARWYHIPAETLALRQTPETVINDLRFCAIAVTSAAGQAEISYIFDIRSVRLVQRHEISPAQAGTTKPSATGMYWLFELGAAHRRAVISVPFALGGRRFSFWITEVADLLHPPPGEPRPGRYSYLYAGG
ncbi:restriction endonuclease-like protein [Chitinibacter sp. ZOR0017]|uniref:restriction endonuclease-like protein n=1 Tax=Chitinibacter sp. ZOR0017 TaxID=1339254 RepID=UPI00068F2B88|nr:restriction endonuclease-like protein [Chitinibacter sp. ZOR0017]